MSKFFLNLLVQISKALVYSKINFYSEKNSPRNFRPTRPFGPIFFFFYRPIFLPSPTGPRPSSRPSPPHAFFLLPHRCRTRTALPPTGLAPPPWSPRRSHRKRKMAASISPSFPQLIGAILPLFNPGNRRLQPHHRSFFKPAIEGARPSPASPPPYKSRPRPR
jgi:hypothetical protein